VHGSYITYSEATAKQAEALKVKQEAALNLSIEQAKLTSFKDGVCPTCGTDTVIKGTEHLHLSDLVEKATFAVNTYTQAVNNTTKIYEYYTKLVSLLTQEIGLKQKLDGLDAQLAAFKDLDETQLNNEIAVIQDKLAYLDKQLQNVDELLNNLNTLDKELSATNAAIEHITTHLSGLIQKETKLSQTNLIKLETELAVCRAEIKQLSLAEAELNALEQKLLPSINARLETLHKTLKQRNVIESYCGCLEQIKQALHPTKLPQALASVYFSRLNASWNQLLSQLDVPFTVELLADSTIQVKFSNNQSAITEQLSGGQRCCLALSFLLTVSSLFNQSVGFIALDEPTYGLDSDHLDRVADLFTNLQTYTTSKNIQMLVVTHEDKLKTYAPYVISL
jgi:DNA repair exonuclease SbcCD ATPase subunit